MENQAFRSEQTKLVRMKRCREQAALTTELLAERATWLARLEETPEDDLLARVGTKRLKKIDVMLMDIASDSDE
jgi:hypothetical protein